jgi:hypothetical protein
MPPYPAIVVAMALLVAACSLAGPSDRTVVALDEAFASARPELASALESQSALGPWTWGLLARPIVLRVSLNESAGKAIDAALAEERRSGQRTVLATSPLIAKAIVGGGSWTGDPTLIVPEWRGSQMPGLWSATTDPVPAYSAAGHAAGAFVAALAKQPGQPSCGVLFSESPSRPRAALTAFADAYAASSDGKPLNVRELDESERSGPGAAISPEDEAEADVKELLGSDIRVLFVALGASSGAAIRAAQRPGLAVGADFPSRETPSALAFRIFPDERGLAKALAAERQAMSRTGEAGLPGASTAVPSLLIAGPAAKDILAGRLDFASFVSAALARSKSGQRKGRRPLRVARASSFPGP